MSHEHRQHPERYYDDEGEAYPFPDEPLTWDEYVDGASLRRFIQKENVATWRSRQVKAQPETYDPDKCPIPGCDCPCHPSGTYS